VYFAEATIAAFFGDDEALDRYSLERMHLAQSGDTEAMQQLEKELPLHLRVAREKARAIETSQSLRDSIDDPEALWQARKEQFGEAAADRLAILDAERQQWQVRLADYRAFLERNADRGNIEALAEAYRIENFSSLEQKRLDAALQASSDL
jgi:lipase chaperone LimK